MSNIINHGRSVRESHYYLRRRNSKELLLLLAINIEWYHESKDGDLIKSCTIFKDPIKERELIDFLVSLKSSKPHAFSTLYEGIVQGLINMTMIKIGQKYGRAYYPSEKGRELAKDLIYLAFEEWQQEDGDYYPALERILGYKV